MTDEKLARIYRPASADKFPAPDILAMLDEANNIVIYRKDLFDDLSDIDKSKVYHLSDKYLRFTTDGAFKP